MKHLLFSIIAVVLFATFSCKKNDAISTPATPKTVFVKLNTVFLDDSKVDSAFAIWKINGEEQRFKMLVRNDSLIAGLGQFIKGTGKLTIHIFSNKKFSNQYSSHWLLNKSISLQETVGASFNGPSSFLDGSWMPRVELNDAANNRAIVGLRPEDSYFKLVDVNPGIVGLVVDKSYWNLKGGVHGIGQGIWECDGNCTDENGDVENTNYFDFIPVRIGNKPWNHVEVVVFYKDTPTSGWSLSLTYDVE